ncbi:hypothetical protein [Nocardia sp. NPDC057227]|uniref:hypothetical protein n=1 Tax=Nocardia sp. NPDC057227 TaxID=3346056 RepID=UPI003644BDF7
MTHSYTRGDRVRLIATGEELTVTKVLPSWDRTTIACEADDPDSDWRICNPEHIEPVEPSRAAAHTARLAAASALADARWWLTGVGYTAADAETITDRMLTEKVDLASTRAMKTWLLTNGDSWPRDLS